MVKIAKALADRTRLRILKEIAGRGKITCGDAVKLGNLSQPTVSHHIKILFEAGLLDAVKNGRHVTISVNKKVFAEFAGMLAMVSK